MNEQTTKLITIAENFIKTTTKVILSTYVDISSDLTTHLLSCKQPSRGKHAQYINVSYDTYRTNKIVNLEIKLNDVEIDKTKYAVPFPTEFKNKLKEPRIYYPIFR